MDGNDLINNAVEMKPLFSKMIDSISYETKGILFSEMYFMQLATDSIELNRILESGRARGQSTLLLSKIFPNTPIISIEHEANSPDVAVAQKRLEHCEHVTLEFGDATTFMPKIAQQGDIALIDGPKGFRGLRFALKLLSSGKFPMIFMHDTTKGTAERKFLEENLERSIKFSDNIDLAKVTSTLDEGKVELPSELQLDGDKGYGFSLVCMTFDESVNYKLLIIKAVFSGAMYRWFKRF
ncbi:MAG: hypothetical protein HAW67_01565 [Endozoicomonadaceae bacterium]|nr:hypothetical protein [Endozoicomonadaceae bacterium]